MTLISLLLSDLINLPMKITWILTVYLVLGSLRREMLTPIGSERISFYVPDNYSWSVWAVLVDAADRVDCISPHSSIVCAPGSVTLSYHLCGTNSVSGNVLPKVVLVVKSPRYRGALASAQYSRILKARAKHYHYRYRLTLGTILAHVVASWLLQMSVTGLETISWSA